MSRKLFQVPEQQITEEISHLPTLEHINLPSAGENFAKAEEFYESKEKWVEDKATSAEKAGQDFVKTKGVALVSGALQKVISLLHAWIFKHRSVGMVLLILATALMAGMHHFFNTSFHGRRADVHYTIGIKQYDIQVFTQTFNVWLEKSFSFLLTSCIGLAFINLLWRSLRNTPLTPQQIDAAFTLPSNPSNAWQLVKVPALWFVASLAGVAWLVPLLTAQVPASLTTVAGPWHIETNCSVQVPSFDTSNPTVDDSSSLYATYNVLNQGAEPPQNQFLYFSYQYSMLELSSQVMAKGSHFAFPSPCGANCSYTANLLVPSLVCSRNESGFAAHYRAQNSSNCLDGFRTCLYWQSSYVGGGSSFNAAGQVAVQPDSFQIMYKDGGLNCTVYETNYTVNFNFSSTRTENPVVQILGSSLMQQLSYNSLAQNFEGTSSIPPDSALPNSTVYTNPALWYTWNNLFGLAQGLVESIGSGMNDLTGSTAASQANASTNVAQGANSYFGFFGTPPVLDIAHSVVNLANFVRINMTSSATYDSLVTFDDPVAALNGLLLNTTISLFSKDSRYYNFQNQTCATGEYQQIYSYSAPRLFKNYGPLLGLGLVIVLLGIIFAVRGEHAGASFTAFATKLEGTQIHKSLLGETDAKVILSAPADVGSSFIFRSFDAGFSQVMA